MLHQQEESKVGKTINNTIIFLLFLGFLWYLYIVGSNWEAISDGNIFIGIIKLIIPLSVNLVISLVLYGKIKLYMPSLIKDKDEEVK